MNFKIFLFVTLLCTSLVSFPNQLSTAQNYSYMDKVRVFGTPIVCAFEKNIQFNEILMSDTRRAVEEWQNKLVQHTGNSKDWNFNFRIVTLSEQQASDFNDCDIRVRFIESLSQLPGKNFETNTSGLTETHFAYSDIWILYLEPEYKKNSWEVGNTEYTDYTPTGKFTKNLAKDNLVTIEHEIGHALGLDHTIGGLWTIRGDKAYSPSIMSHPNDRLKTQEQIFQITEFDINSILNYYGDKGFNSYQSVEQWILENMDCKGEKNLEDGVPTCHITNDESPEVNIPSNEENTITRTTCFNGNTDCHACEGDLWPAKENGKFVCQKDKPDTFIASADSEREGNSDEVSSYMGLVLFALGIIPVIWIIRKGF